MKISITKKLKIIFQLLIYLIHQFEWIKWGWLFIDSGLLFENFGTSPPILNSLTQYPGWLWRAWWDTRRSWACPPPRPPWRCIQSRSHPRVECASHTSGTNSHCCCLQLTESPTASPIAAAASPLIQPSVLYWFSRSFRIKILKQRLHFFKIRIVEHNRLNCVQELVKIHVLLLFLVNELQNAI